MQQLMLDINKWQIWSETIWKILKFSTENLPTINYTRFYMQPQKEKETFFFL